MANIRTVPQKPSQGPAEPNDHTARYMLEHTTSWGGISLLEDADGEDFRCMSVMFVISVIVVGDV